MVLRDPAAHEVRLAQAHVREVGCRRRGWCVDRDPAGLTASHSPVALQAPLPPVELRV